MAEPGIRLTSLPDLGAPNDASRVAGARVGIGTFTLPAIKTYVLGSINATLDAQNSAILALQATTGDASAVLALQTTVAGLQTAASLQLTTNATTASALTSLSVTNTNQDATLASQATSLSVLASVNATLGATYTVKTNVSGQVVGFGLTNSGTPTGTGITFTTPTFKIFDGTTGQTPFEVVGGVVSIKNAAIQTASITQFKMADGSVVTAKMALNAASEAFSFYTDDQPLHYDTIDRNYISGTITVPAGGSAYVFPRGQGFTYDGTAFVFRFYVDGTLVAQFDNPTSNFVAPYGAQSLQTPTPQIVVIGAGVHTLSINFQALAVPADPSLTPKPIIGHIVGFVQKR